MQLGMQPGAAHVLSVLHVSPEGQPPHSTTPHAVATAPQSPPHAAASMHPTVAS